MSARQRKGHDYEKIDHEFTEEDLESMEPRTMFIKKWIIIEKLEKRGSCYCYRVCDKPVKTFGILYLEIGEDNVTSIANQIDFSHHQTSLGHSHRFTNIIDAGIINNHVFYMVVMIRAGPTLDALLNCVRPEKLSPIATSFLAIDLISVIELLTSTGYILRNFDPKQWMLDVKSRQFYLADTTDVSVSSDKRHRPIQEDFITTAEEVNLHWNSADLSHAPRSFLLHGSSQRMSELDLLEMTVYILYELAHGKLPWKSVTDRQGMLRMKTEFLETYGEQETQSEDVIATWFERALQNMTEHLKEARKLQERLETMQVRGGAWCPKGPRAGALSSAVNYRKLIDDFHRVVVSGRPSWSVNWRDVKLDWEKTIAHTPETRKRVLDLQKYQFAQGLADEWDRLMAIRVHCELRKEHAELEQEKNEKALEKYLTAREDVQVIAEIPKKTKKKVAEKVLEKEVKVEEDYVEEVKKEEEMESASNSSSPSPMTLREARARRRLVRQIEEQKEELDIMMEKQEIKEEEPDY